jgi:hypothetical protein
MNNSAIARTWDINPERREAFRAACLDAGADEAAFAAFRSHPAIQIMVGGIDAGVADKCWAYLNSHARDWFRAHRETILKCDRIGGAQGVDKYGGLTPEMLRYAYRAWCLTAVFGDMAGWHVVEIGGGFGGLAALCALTTKLRRYTRVDLPEALKLQRRYLERVGAWNKVLLGPPGCLRCSDPDLLISDCALTETSDEMLARYGTELVDRSPRGSIVANNVRKTGEKQDWGKWLAQCHTPIHGSAIPCLGIEDDESTYFRNHWYWGVP